MVLLVLVSSLVLAQFARVTGQTYSACNPLHSTACPPNTALGKTIDVDFTKGAVESFVPSGNPTYDTNGAHFTVSGTGDAPQLNSIFYIMFGKVSITMKTAPGAGIVSSLVLQSDTLDEIDIEWLGAKDSEMQTNYFGKGDTSTYDRGAFSPVSNHEQQYITYSIEWTSSQITWSVDNKVVRVLTPETAAMNQYPQTPMQVKFGAWSAGDPANQPGTIQWANGPTDYSKGPFTMSVKSISVSDYSSGTQYRYGDQSGNWGSIVAVGGNVKGDNGGSANKVLTAEVPSITSPSLVIPAGLGKNHDSTSTMTMWPWVATTTQSKTSQSTTSTNGLPSGWVITSSGKVVPANSAAIPPPLSPSLSSSSSSSDSVYEDKINSDYQKPSFVSTNSRNTTSNSNEDQASLANSDTADKTCYGSSCKGDKEMSNESASSAKLSKRVAWANIVISGLGAFILEHLI